MKKLILLFSIVCAGQLYGMEAENIMDLPEEIRNEIINAHNELIKKALASSNTLEEAVQAIKAGALQGVKYDNLEDFTRLVRILADKFGVYTEQVALAFNIPIAEKYIELGQSLIKSIESFSLKAFYTALEEGADMNFTNNQGQLALNLATLLFRSLWINEPEESSESTFLFHVVNTLRMAGAKDNIYTF